MYFGSCTLRGVIAQQDNYRQSGFTLAYRNIRYGGMIQSKTDAVAIDGAEALDTVAQEHLLKPLTELDTRLLTYDRSFFPDDRTAFLQRWMAEPTHYGVGLIAQARLVGYGVVRPCQRGYKIGPLFADGAEEAEVILQTLKRHMVRKEQERGWRDEGGAIAYPFYLDVPEPNAPAIALAERHGMTPMFETARMYAPQGPDLPVDRIFGVTTFEWG